jgi:DNA-binding NarL/FixJ family response regulator
MTSPTNSDAFFLRTAPQLSPRETRVAELLLQAKRNPEIAAVMRISDRTVKQYMYRLFSKLGLSNGWRTHSGDGRIRLAVLIHEHREALGVRCQACGEL